MTVPAASRILTTIHLMIQTVILMKQSMNSSLLELSFLEVDSASEVRNYASVEMDSAWMGTCCVFVVAVVGFVVLEKDFVCEERDFSVVARKFFGGLTCYGEATLTSFCMKAVVVETGNVICVSVIVLH